MLSGAGTLPAGPQVYLSIAVVFRGGKLRGLAVSRKRQPLGIGF